MQTIFLPTPIVLNPDPSLTDPTDKTEKCKICIFVTYDLHCPSAAISNPDYVCRYVKCQKSFTTKKLLKLHLKSTQHHGYAYEVFNHTDLTQFKKDMGHNVWLTDCIQTNNYIR